MTGRRAHWSVIAQVMVTKEVAAAVGGLKDLVPTGTSVLIEGELTEAPAKAKQVLHR